MPSRKARRDGELCPLVQVVDRCRSGHDVAALGSCPVVERHVEGLFVARAAAESVAGSRIPVCGALPARKFLLGVDHPRFVVGGDPFETPL